MKPKTNKKRIASEENFGTKQLYGLRENSLGSNGN
jgi:hypothetical protein